MTSRIAPTRRVRGAITVPGDKSICHRALFLAALAEGTTTIEGLSGGDDVRSTRRCLEALGVEFISDGNGRLRVRGNGGAFASPSGTLDCGNSGTTMRLLCAILAGRDLEATLDGDASLRSRPMGRIAEPLRAMGARIELSGKGVAPILIRGGAPLHAIAYELPLPSAQLKSALILAALDARGATTLGGALGSRDHTERILPLFGGRIVARDGALTIEGEQRLRAPSDAVRIPGDLSSAAYWIAAAAIVPESRVQISGVGLNPTRMGFVDALRRMGTTIEIRIQEHPSTTLGAGTGEPSGTIVVESAPLRGIELDAADVPALIDELPVLAVVAACAEGTTRVRGAQELRVKESDRIEAIVRNGAAMGMKIEAYPDGYAVSGPSSLHGAEIDAMGDHRVAMAFAIAALAASGTTTIRDAGSAAVSYPEFFSTLEVLRDG